MESVVLPRSFVQRVTSLFVVIFLLGFLKESYALITFTEEPSSTYIIIGKPLSLNCTATSSATFKYSWQFNGKKITANARRTIKSDGTLAFTNAQAQDVGEYVCVVIIKQGDKRIRKRSRKALLFIPSICSIPRIGINPNRLQHATDSKVEMTCNCNAQPDATVKWFKDGKQLTNGGKYSISSNKLVMGQPKIADSAKYHCNASNVMGTVESQAMAVEFIDAVRPTFEQKLKPQLFAKKKANFKMECRATGKPKPVIKWYKDGSRFHMINTSRITVGEDGTLAINNVEESDFSTYKCQASNFLDSIAMDVTLSKAYFSDIHTDLNEVSYAEVGKEFTVRCKVNAAPKPNLTWQTSNGGAVPASYAVKGDMLTNIDVKLSDSANFTCVGQNMAGTKSTTIQVIAAEYPKLVGQPKHTAINENGKGKLECPVTSSIPFTVLWKKNGDDVELDNLHKINSNNALVFKRMSIIDQGVYKCIVTSAAAAIPLTSQSANLTMDAAVRLAKHNMNHHKFDKGSKARIYCSFTGAEPITVTWKKLGKTPMDGNAISSGDTLTIGDIRMEDQGIYECTGSNSFSNATTTVSISVYIYPKFVLKPNNVTIEEFGSFWVYCNATGYPKPKITFSKEALHGDKLPPRFHQYQNGSMYIERILPEDRGNYYCIAANIANLKQATFSLRVITPPGTKANNKASTMGRTIAIAVGCAAAYIVLVVGLMIYCKRRRAKQQKKEQLTIDAADIDNGEADPEIPLQPVNGKPSNYNKMEFPRHDLEALRTLGNGSYGRSFLARASGIKDGERETMVVVKSLMSKDDIQKEDFWRELNALVKMDNPHVVGLLGVCRDIDPIYMIFEQLEKGDLKQYLLSCYENGRSTLTSSQKLSLCSNVVSGMSYLTSNNFVHKDVAARNCMVTKDLQVKVGFLSLSYDLYSSEYFRFNNILIPLRWMAPEAIFNDEFSEKSDVWSFGVLIWEIYSLGQTPFEDRPDEEVLKCIKEDLRLSKPDNCPDSMANIMKKCWESSPDDRPPFEKLYAEISEIAVDTHL